MVKNWAKTLKTKALLIGITLTMFIAGFVFFSYKVMEERAVEDHIINLVGAQRMRLFEIAYHLNVYSEDTTFNTKEIHTHIKDFDNVLNSLRNGSAKLQILPLATILPTKDMTKLDIIEAKWLKNKTLIHQALSALNYNHTQEADYYKKQYIDGIHSFVTEDINSLLMAVNIDIKNDTTKYLLSLILFFIILGAVGIYIYLWFLKVILNPIIKISSTAKKLGSNLQVRITDLHQNNEIGELALTFNNMADNIEKAVISTREIAHENALILEAEITKKTHTLNITIQELEKANKIKTGFLANMSHELRTPLNAIIGFSELIKDGTAGEINDKQAEYVSYIIKAGTHLLSLVTNILSFSKIKSGKDLLNLTLYPLKSLISDSLTMFHDCKNKHNITLRTDISSEAEGMEDLMVDVVKFKQVMINLISNAIKFTPEGGCVAIRAISPDRKAG